MDDLESIYRQNADTVFRFLMAKTGSPDLSEELTQETFYQAIKSIDRFDGSCRISSAGSQKTFSILISVKRRGILCL